MVLVMVHMLLMLVGMVVVRYCSLVNVVVAFRALVRVTNLLMVVVLVGF